MKHTEDRPSDTDNTKTDVSTSVVVTPPSMTQQEIACLKTALALVVVKRRLVARRSEQQLQEDRMDVETTTPPTNLLCPWMPVEVFQNNPSGEMAWRGATLINGNTSSQASDWAHLDHMMGLACTRAAQGASHASKSGHLESLTTHLAHQLLNLSRSSSSVEDSSVTDWIQSILGTHPPGSPPLEAICDVWHGMLTANTGVAALLLPVLIPLLQQTMEGSPTSTSSEDPSGGVFYLDLLEHVLVSAPVESVEQVLEVLTGYLWPVSLENLAACHDWNRRLIGSKPTAAASNLLLRHGLSDILQRALVTHNQSKRDKSRV